MTQRQREAYDDADEIGSDVFHILDRDNRNHRKKRRLIERHTHAAPGSAILEVGCGHGLHARAYARRYHYTGVDISERLVGETRKRVDAVSNHWRVMQADAMDLPWGADEFDAVVGTAILHHLHSPGTALREWQRVTRPGGSITLMEPNYLFPKEILTAHLIDHERHKTNMRPDRLRGIIDDATPDDTAWTVEPRIYTLPWPATLHGVYDRLDAALRRVPGLRWVSQMLLIHVEC